jgi:tetratricopeptide (TPR) repeat protein
METTASQLDMARRGNDPDELAAALTNHANSLITSGQITDARKMLDEAAAIHQHSKHPYDEARCTHLAATLCRMEGNIPEARKRIQRAEELAEPGTPIAVSVATEYGEIAFSLKDGLKAAAAYQRAFDEGCVAGLTDVAKSALLRKRANALVMSAKHEEAAIDLDTAYELLVKVGDTKNAVRVLVEKATALHQGGIHADAERAINIALEEARVGNDYHALSDLYLLNATIAIQQHNLSAALEAAHTARSHALSAIAPLSYVSAALAIAEINETSKDRVAAYEALACGWATVSDLLGPEAAKDLFEPKMMAMQQSWGSENFTRAKETYEAERRAVMQ